MLYRDDVDAAGVEEIRRPAIGGDVAGRDRALFRVQQPDLAVVVAQQVAGRQRTVRDAAVVQGPHSPPRIVEIGVGQVRSDLLEAASVDAGEGQQRRVLIDLYGSEQFRGRGAGRLTRVRL